MTLPEPYGFIIDPDTGLSNDDCITNQTVTTVSVGLLNYGTGFTVTIYNGDMVIGSADANSYRCIVTLSSPLSAEGVYSLTAIESLGPQTRSRPGAFVVTVDKTAPPAPVISGMGPDTGASASDRIASSVTSVAGSAEAGSMVTIYNGAVALGSGKTSDAGVFNVTLE